MEKDNILKVSGIEMDSIVDGPGIRMAIFFQGCPHHCEGCHNPETWDYEADCLNISVKDILDIFDNDPILSGVTFSGGEPMSPRNFEGMIEISKEMKKRKKNVWSYTGYTIDKLIEKYPDLKDNLLPYIDVLVDGPFVLKERNLMLSFRGSNNQRLVDVQKYLKGESEYIIER